MSAEIQEISLDTMPLLRRESRAIHEPLNLEELQGNAHELGRLRGRIADEKEALKEYAKVKRGEIAEFEKRLAELIKLGDRGREEMVECEIRADRSSGRRLVVRTDTREIIADEPLSERDRQPLLFAAPTRGEPTTPVDPPAVVDSPTVLEGPPSRRCRQAFIDSLGDEGGELVKRLHDAGLLDPRPADLERFRGDFERASINRTPAYMVGEAESALDDMEPELAAKIDGSDLGIDDLTAMAERIREEPAVRVKPDEDGWEVEEALLVCVERRAELELALEAEASAAATTEEHSSLLDQVVDEVAGRVNAGALDSDTVKVTAEVRRPKRGSKKAPRKAAKKGDPPATEPPSDYDISAIASHARAFRSMGLDARVGRWECPIYWEAHDVGILDPKPDDAFRATKELGRAGQPDAVFNAIMEGLDATEQDLAADILGSSKARIALSRGEFPTNVLKVDVGVVEVRYQRARLGVVVHYGKEER